MRLVAGYPAVGLMVVLLALALVLTELPVLCVLCCAVLCCAQVQAAGGALPGGPGAGYMWHGPCTYLTVLCRCAVALRRVLRAVRFQVDLGLRADPLTFATMQQRAQRCSLANTGACGSGGTVNPGGTYRCSHGWFQPSRQYQRFGTKCTGC